MRIAKPWACVRGDLQMPRSKAAAVALVLLALCFGLGSCTNRMRISDIQRLIDAHPAGTTIHLQARAYRVMATIVPKPGDQLLGAGDGITVLDGDGASFNGVDAMTGITDVVVAGLTVRGFEDGIRLGPSWTVRDVEATEDVIGLQFGGFDDATIADSYVHDNSRFGIHGNSTNGQVIGTEVSYNHTDPSWPEGFSGGLKLLDCAGAVVRDDSIHDNYGNGLWFDEGVQNAVATDNHVYGNRGDGIRVEISSDVQLVNNTVSGSIVVLNSRGTLVQGNTITAPSTVAMPLRIGGNGRTENGVEYVNADNQVVGNSITLLPGQTVGVVRVAGTTTNNAFGQNVYLLPSLTTPAFDWWDGTQMRQVDWAAWMSLYGQDVGGRASPAP